MFGYDADRSIIEIYLPEYSPLHRQRPSQGEPLALTGGARSQGMPFAAARPRPDALSGKAVTFAGVALAHLLGLAGLALLLPGRAPSRPEPVPPMVVSLVEAASPSHEPVVPNAPEPRRTEERVRAPAQAETPLPKASAPVRSSTPLPSATVMVPVPVPAPSRAEPPPSPPPAAPAPPPSADLDGPIALSWTRDVGGWIARHKTYPAEARARRAEGHVCVRVGVGRDGRVDAVDLTCSSGSDVLEAAARRLFEGARLPTFPASMRRGNVTLELTLDYSLVGGGRGADQNMPR